GTTWSAVPWRKIVGASPASMSSLVGVPPETETVALIVGEKPGFPLVPGSSDRVEASTDVTAPADAPPIAILSVSILYVPAFARSHLTAAWASCWPASAASWQIGVGLGLPPHPSGDSSR